MPRFPQPRRKPKARSIFEQARRFYGRAFEVASPRDLSDAMADWADLGAPERTFTLSHLLYLNLMAQAGVQALLHQLLLTVEDVADDLDEDDGNREEDDLEDEPAGEPEDDFEDGTDQDEPVEPESEEAPPPGVTIPGPAPSVVTPPASEEDDLEGDEWDGAPAESDIEGGP